MKRNGWYCGCCKMVVFKQAEYNATEDHTCTNCCNDYLIPVVVTDELPEEETLNKQDEEESQLPRSHPDDYQMFG